MAILKRLGINDVGGPTQVGGNDWDELYDYLNDASLTGKSASVNTPTTFESSKITIGGYCDLTKIAAPAGNPSATNVRLYPDTADGILKVKKSTGSVVSLESTGDITAAANVGTGTGQIFRDKTGSQLNMKTLLAGSNITLTNNANDITVASTGGGGAGVDVLPLVYTYVIYKSGATYYAKNGTTGAVDYSNANARALFQTISTALLGTSGNHLKIYLKNGIYPMDSTTLIWGNQATAGGTASVEIIGETMNGVIIRNTYTPATASNFYVWDVQCSITLRDMSFDGASLGDFAANKKVCGIVAEVAPATGRYFKMYNCHLYAYTGIACVVDQNTWHTDVRSCHFELGAGEEYLAFGCENGYVIGNFFNRQNATYSPWTALTTGHLNNCVISNNVLWGNPSSQDPILTIEFINASVSNYTNLVINDNTINYGDIVLGGFDNSGLIMRNVTVDGNLLEKGRIWVAGPATTTYTNSIKRIDVRNNTIVASNLAGILLTRVADQVIVSNNTIHESNQVHNASYGNMGAIMVSEATNVLLKNNYIVMTDAATDGSPYGIGAYGTTNLHIIDNRLHITNGKPAWADWGTNTNLRFKRNYGAGIVSENEGATSVADGGTISHGLYTTPTVVTVNPSLADHTAAITAKNASTFTVGLRIGNTGGPGTTQTVYWRASV